MRPASHYFARHDMKRIPIYPLWGLLLLTGAVLPACTAKKPVSSEGAAIEKTLEQAEKDARSGNEAKAIQEINQAETALKAEDKKKPLRQGFKTEQGLDVKERADEEALKELEHAKSDAGKRLAGDAADEIHRASQAVRAKEGN